MTIPYILVATGCYLMTAIGNLRQKDYPMALVWISYSTANLALVWYEIRKG